MRVRLAEHGRTLATRPLGRELREGLGHQIAGPVELDFDGVLAVSHSFADEFVGRLAELAVQPGSQFEIRVFGATEEVLSVIEKAVELRDAGQVLKVANPA